MGHSSEVIDKGKNKREIRNTLGRQKMGDIKRYYSSERPVMLSGMNVTFRIMYTRWIDWL